MSTELTDEQKKAAELEEENKKKAAEGNKGFTDEDFEKEVERRLGAKPSDLIKKSEQVVVLTDEEKKAKEEKEAEDALKYGLESGFIKKSEYDEYQKLVASDKVDIARKKFMKLNPDMKDADKVFDTILRIDEDDELEDGENKVPNKEKMAAKAWATKLADEEIENTYGSKIKSLPAKHKEFLEQKKVEKVNSELIQKTLSEIPKRLEDEFAGVKFGIDISDEDFKEAEKLVSTQLGKKGLTADEVKENINIFLSAKNRKRFVEEGIRVAVAEALDRNKRGEKGLLESMPDKGAGGISAKMKALIKQGIVPAGEATKT